MTKSYKYLIITHLGRFKTPHDYHRIKDHDIMIAGKKYCCHAVSEASLTQYIFWVILFKLTQKCVMCIS